MTEQRIAELVVAWQRRLGLLHWRIHLSFPGTVGEYAAQIEFERDYDEATIEVAPGYQDWDDRYGEEIIVHELVHALERPLLDHFTDVLDQLHPAAAPIADLTYRHHRERMIERLAWSLVALGRGDLDSTADTS